jgi:3-hydroxyacyl-CoA dehydrogenase
MLGVLGAGQMGTGIALVPALRAKVPVRVLLYDRSTKQVTKGLSLMDKLLAKMWQKDDCLAKKPNKPGTRFLWWLQKQELRE